MEHRWGKRSTVNVAATLHLACGTAARGRIVNVSLSGAFVLTEVRIPLFSRVVVELELGVPGYSCRQFVPGYVVREALGGFGLEWNEFSPSAIENIRPGGVARLAADVEPNLQHNSRTHPSLAGSLFERRLRR